LIAKVEETKQHQQIITFSTAQQCAGVCTESKSVLSGANITPQLIITYKIPIDHHQPLQQLTILSINVLRSGSLVFGHIDAVERKLGPLRTSNGLTNSKQTPPTAGGQRAGNSGSAP
jgi:hypothetical protein